jgi:hypothetical protein
MKETPSDQRPAVTPFYILDLLCIERIVFQQTAGQFEGVWRGPLRWSYMTTIVLYGSMTINHAFVR